MYYVQWVNYTSMRYVYMSDTGQMPPHGMTDTAIMYVQV